MDAIVSHLVNVGNALLKEIEHRPEVCRLAEEFFRGILKGCVGSSFGMARPPDYWKSVQIIGQQGLNILSWNHHQFPGAPAVRLTDNPARMISAPGRDPSYLDRETFAQVPADQEGRPGPYWRGLEGFGKVEKSLIPSLIDSEDFARDNLVLYTMVHGVLPMPEAIRTETEAGRISTFHDTAFLWDRVPGTRQAASTGAGHFQGNQLDLKQVVEGYGVQFNVSYDEHGAVRHVYGQRLKPFTWTMAFPGHVDYIVNTGGLRFHDVSLRLTADCARLFGEGAKPTDLSRAPVALDTDGTVMSACANAPPLIWVEWPDLRMKELPWKSLALLYTHLTDSITEELLGKISTYLKQKSVVTQPNN
ncbi:MAG: hypothetical protein IPN19_05610 [Elusimicrobia bacterium]|nr:hypothetical protein [Elusimicrobiota bacterium]